MIVADSSVWIGFIRTPEDIDGRAFRRLLESARIAMVGPVLVEVMRGVKGDADKVDGLLQAVPFIESTREQWIAAGRLARQLENAGTRVPFGDVLIAGTVQQGDHQLFTRDKHFERIPGLRLYKPEEDANA